MTKYFAVLWQNVIIIFKLQFRQKKVVSAALVRSLCKNFKFFQNNHVTSTERSGICRSQNATRDFCVPKDKLDVSCVRSKSIVIQVEEIGMSWAHANTCIVFFLRCLNCSDKPTITQHLKVWQIKVGPPSLSIIHLTGNRSPEREEKSSIHLVVVVLKANYTNRWLHLINGF